MELWHKTLGKPSMAMICFFALSKTRLSSLLIILYCACVSAQKLSPSYIDSIQEKGYSKFFNEGKFTEGIEFSKQIINDSKKIGYKKGIAKSNIHIAIFLMNLSENNQSLIYL